MDDPNGHKHYQLAQDGADNTNTSDIWHSSFGGVHLIQAWQDLMLWERFLHQYTPQFIIELGTFGGGLSVFLAMQAWAIQAGFITVDWQDWAPHDHPLWKNLGLDHCFWHADMWTPDFTERFKKLVGEDHNHPFLLLCDGGNKPKEFNTFGKILRPGDYIACHDWMNEIGPEDIKDMPVRMLLQAECENLKSLTRFFLVT